MTSLAEPAEPSEPSEAGRADVDPWIGRVLAGRYRIDARLGSGGMGAVYRGHHLALDREVAIKVLHARLTEDPVVAKRFDREALAASKLDHPGCVQMLDAGTAEDGTKFLVMQLLSGRELRSMQDGPMPADRVVELVLQILAALEHAHRRGLVHRDLKPENVIVTRDDDDREVVKLLDFGIVKLLAAEGADDKLTRAGVVFGTPRYMSPEQAAGGKIDARADLYAVGVMMYELLAGAPPFQGDDMGIVLRMHILADPPPLPEHVPEPLRAVVMRLLQKRAADRFASAKETQDALAAFAGSATGPFVAAPLMLDTIPSPSGVEHTVLAVPAPMSTHPSSRRRASALLPWVAIAVVLLLGIGIAWAIVSARDDRAPTVEIERPAIGDRPITPAVGASPGAADEPVVPEGPPPDDDDDADADADADERAAAEPASKPPKKASKRRKKKNKGRGRRGEDRD